MKYFSILYYIIISQYHTIQYYIYISTKCYRNRIKITKKFKVPVLAVYFWNINIMIVCKNFQNKMKWSFSSTFALKTFFYARNVFELFWNMSLELYKMKWEFSSNCDSKKFCISRMHYEPFS